MATSKPSKKAPAKSAGSAQKAALVQAMMAQQSQGQGQPQGPSGPPQPQMGNGQPTMKKGGMVKGSAKSAPAKSKAKKK